MDIYAPWLLQSQVILSFNYGLNDKELSDSVSASNTLYNASHKAFLGSPRFYPPGQLSSFLSVVAASSEDGHQSQISKRPGVAATSHPAFVGLSLCLYGTGEGSGSEGTESIGKVTPSPMPRTLVFGH